MANIPFLNNAYFAAKVGIGTDSPERLLSLYSNNAETTPRLLIEQDGTGDAVMAFSLTGGQGWSMGIDNSGSDSFMIHNSAGGVDSSSQFTIKDNGNVGIGTTSPQNPLHVNGSLRIGPFLTPDRDGFVFIPGGSLNTIQANNENTNFDNNQGNIHIRTINNSSATPVERITILSTGNVGIGTTNPGEKLDIVGKQIFSGVGSNQYGNPGAFNTASNGDKIIFYNDGASYDGRIGVGNASNLWLKSYGETPSEGDIEFYAGGSRRAIIKGTGNVGIGTNNPGKKLEVDGTFKATGDTSVDGTGNLFIRNRLATGSGIVFIDNVWQGGIEHISGNLYFRTGGQVDKMTIKTNGNVGIGTTSPTAKLEVKGGSGVNTTLRVSTDGTATPEPAIQLYRNDVAYGEVSYNAGGNVSGESGLIYTDYRDDASSKHIWKTRNAEKMRLTSVGNVGIGTNSPVQKLHINNSTASSVSYAKFSNAQTGATTADGFDIGVNTGAEAVIWQRENTNLLFATNNSEKMRITSSGILMVGGTTGGYAGTKIHVGNFSDTQNGINILSSTTGYGYVLFGDGTGADTYRGQIAYSHSDDSMVFNTNGSEKLRIVSGGGISFAGATNFGSAGQVLKSNGSASPAWVDASTVIGGPYLPLSAGSTKPLTGDLFLTLSSSTQRALSSSGTNSLQIGDAGVQELKFKNASGNSFLISASGNVGIGTTSPASKLHVVGTDGTYQTRIGHSTQSLYLTVDGANVDYKSSGSSAGSHSFSTGNTERMRIASNGNVGIGTTSPGGNLHVVGNAGSSGQIYLSDRDNGTGTGDALLINKSGTSAFIYNRDSGDLRLGSNDQSSMVSIKSTGNVGIGTTNPSEKLGVFGNIRLENGAQRNIIGPVNENLGIFANPNGSDEGILFSTDNGATTEMIILNGGNVGIGTDSPSAPLHINGGANSEVLKVEATSDPFMRFVENGTNVGFLQFTGGTAYLANMANGDFRFRTNNTDQMILTNQGRLGIGTTSPVYKLDANGGVRAGGVITYSKPYSNLNTTGQAVAGLTSSSNGNSTGFTFTCFGDTGGYQKIVYSCYNDMGTWRTKKVINEGTNNFDVEASADGSTITFTFKSTSGTKYYTPRVTIEATGHSINSTYA